MNPYNQPFTPCLEVPSANNIDEAIEKLNAWRPLGMKPLIVTTMGSWDVVFSRMRRAQIDCHKGVKVGFNWDDAAGWLDLRSLLRLNRAWDAPIVWLDCETGLRLSGMTTGERTAPTSVMRLGLDVLQSTSAQLIWYGLDAMHPRPKSGMQQINALQALIQYIAKRRDSVFVDSVSGYSNWYDVRANADYGGPRMWVEARKRLYADNVRTVRLIYVQPHAGWHRRRPFREDGIAEVIKSPGCIVYPGWSDFEYVGQKFSEELS